MSVIYTHQVRYDGRDCRVTKYFPEQLNISEHDLRQIRECKHDFLHLNRREQIMACLDNGEAIYVPDGSRVVGTYYRIYQRIDWVPKEQPLPAPRMDHEGDAVYAD